MSFYFDLDIKSPSRRRMRDIHNVFTGVAGPYGEVTITVTRVPRKAELSSTTLPSAWILHPLGIREGLVTIDETTRLVVGDHEAELVQNRRALRKEDRGLHIHTGDRNYQYLAVKPRKEELSDTLRGPVCRIERTPKVLMRVTVLPNADPTDIALALILQGADRHNLTLARAVASNIWYFFNNGTAPT
ncbi:hypothetical protein [Thermopolyspora flexuosa]|nr:hypothetical protein [Thermopolyspora flexuosa]